MKIRKTVVRFVAVHDDGDEDAILEAMTLAGQALSSAGIVCGMSVDSRVIEEDARPEPARAASPPPAPDRTAN